MTLLEKLKRHRPYDAAEAEALHRIVGFVSREPRPFDRATAEGHVTGSAWLVDASGDRVLLTHHRKLNLWLQLGGHSDGDPDTLRVAMKEAAEESGLKKIFPVSDGIFDVDVHEIPARPNEPAHLHYDVRFALKSQDDVFSVGEESHDLAWVRVDRIAERTSERSMLRMAEKWLARRANENSTRKSK